jgi:hypothetical protein
MSQRIFTQLILSIAMLGLAACSSDSQEMWRVASPDSRVDAVFVRLGGPAMVGFSYKLFLVPHGASLPSKGERLLSERVKNLSVTWREAKTLDIRYDEALIYGFMNYWHSKEVDDHKYVVELCLVPTGPSQLGELKADR